MLNTKKTLTKVLQWIAGLSVETTALSSVSIAASGAADASGSIAKTGKTPLGIVAITKAGAGSGDVTFTAYYLSGSNAVVSLRNLATASRTITCSVSVLYKKA